jgi:hypothetical protein
MQQLKLGINGTSTAIFRTIIFKHRTGYLPLSGLDPGLERWIRDGWLVAFKTPEGHCREELEGLQRPLRQYGIFLCPISVLYICILISYEDPSIAKLFADILADDLRGFHLTPPTDGYDALMKVDMVRPSLLILDVFIPRLDGMAVCPSIGLARRAHGGAVHGW